MTNNFLLLFVNDLCVFSAADFLLTGRCFTVLIKISPLNESSFYVNILEFFSKFRLDFLFDITKDFLRLEVFSIPCIVLSSPERFYLDYFYFSSPLDCNTLFLSIFYLYTIAFL